LQKKEFEEEKLPSEAEDFDEEKESNEKIEQIPIVDSDKIEIIE